MILENTNFKSAAAVALWHDLRHQAGERYAHIFHQLLSEIAASGLSFEEFAYRYRDAQGKLGLTSPSRIAGGTLVNDDARNRNRFVSLPQVIGR